MISQTRTELRESPGSNLSGIVEIAAIYPNSSLGIQLYITLKRMM